MRDAVLLAVLLLTAAGLRGWLMTHTEVAARDSIGYIRQAWQLERQPWPDALRDAQQHPGYPAAILGMSRLVRLAYAAPEPALMQVSAQLASSLAGVLLVLPMFYLGKSLFGRGAGFGAALLFQALPAANRVLGDGLSEGVFLLFAATALLAAAVALRRRSVVASACTGLCGGLAYLTRPEGAFVVAATAVVFVALALAAGRGTWRRTFACLASLLVAAGLVGGPLVLVTGKLTVKATPEKLFDEWFKGKPAAVGEPAVAQAGVAPLLADWWTEQDGPREAWARRAVAMEIVKGSHYVLWVPMLVGLFLFRGRFRSAPGAWVLLLVSAAVTLCLWRVAARMGYVSSRHALLILMCGCFWAAAALPELARAIVWLGERTPPLSALRGLTPAADSPAWSVLFLVGLTVSMLPKAVEPLHTNRIGFRHAGLWLAQNAQPWDTVIDPYCWSHFYAGKVRHEHCEPTPPPGVAPTTFVVLEESGHEHERLPLMEPARLLKGKGVAVFRWTGRRDKEIVDVVIYAVTP